LRQWVFRLTAVAGRARRSLGKGMFIPEEVFRAI
jgi:hypothetical protein